MAARMSALNLGIAVNGVGRKLVAYEFRKWHALPAAMTQKVMGNGHGFDAPVEGSDKLIHGAAGLLRMRGDDRNCCEHS